MKFKSVFILFLALQISAGFASDKTLQNGIISLQLSSNNSSAEVYINANGKNILAASSENLFSMEVSGQSLQFTTLEAEHSSAKEIAISGKDNSNKIKATLSFDLNSSFQNSINALFSIENTSGNVIELTGIKVTEFLLDAKNLGADSSYKFWSFQGGSYISRPDWILPVTANYSRENFMGNNSPDYGGGVPVVDLWTKEAGLAFACTSVEPEQISLPVKSVSGKGVEFKFSLNKKIILKPGEKYDFMPFSIIAHTGDFYNALNIYSKIMHAKGITAPQPVSSAFETEWCAWGYARNFVPSQITSTLAKAKEIGFEWATLDDGFQNADGDWGLMESKFPSGDKDFKAIVDSMHKHNLKARLWWVPYSANDSAYNVKHFPNRMNEYAMKVQSKLAIEHPDWFILDEKGNRYQIEWWNSYLLCPALPEVKEHFNKFVIKAINEWGFDGFKIDGQNINAVPPCYNPQHKHKDPEESAKAVPDFYEMVYKTTYSLKKDAVVQICPCGTNFSFYNIPYTTQFVSSDPLSSWQVRHRGKTFRALVGNQVPYSGDHVELTNRRWDPDLQKSIRYKDEDFASTVGVGGVVASKFTMPGITQEDSSVMLTPDKEAKWKHWVSIYKNERLSEGDYTNLYDIAFDKPETHLIKKDDVLYYALYSDETYKGNVELRGLGAGTYQVVDYVNNKIIGEVNTSSASIQVEFKDYLLLKAVVKK